jgi:biotin-(acetyl-CoA carboxylase) ligase
VTTQLPQTGRFLGLDADGALILGLEDGTSHIIHSGDVGVLT